MSDPTIWLIQHIGYKPARILYAIGQTVLVLVLFPALLISVVGAMLIAGELTIIFVGYKPFLTANYATLYFEAVMIGAIEFTGIGIVFYVLKVIVVEVVSDFERRYPTRKEDNA